MTVRIGIIGTGGMGARHARNLHAKIVGAEVVALSDLDEHRARQVAGDCGGAAVTSDPVGLIHDARVEAVVIASPDATHADLTLECLAVGKPVLCEKPLATDAADARRVVDAEVARGERLVAVGFMRRFDPAHRSVKEAVGSGVLGRPVLFKGVHRNARAPEGYTSALGVSASAVHDFDSARWLLEREVETVYARGVRADTRLDDGAFDLLTFQLGLSGDTLASIEVYVNAGYGYDVSAEIVGQRGTAVTAQPDTHITRLDNRASVPVAEDWLVRFQDAYVAELDHWLASLHGAPFEGASAWDGYLSLLVSDACLRSLESGRVETLPDSSRPALYR